MCTLQCFCLRDTVVNPGRCGCNFKVVDFNLISRILGFGTPCEMALWNCPHVNATRLYRWLVNTYSVNTLLLETILIRIYGIIWRYTATMSLLYYERAIIQNIPIKFLISEPTLDHPLPNRHKAVIKITGHCIEPILWWPPNTRVIDNFQLLKGLPGV